MKYVVEGMGQVLKEFETFAEAWAWAVPRAAIVDVVRPA